MSLSDEKIMLPPLPPKLPIAMLDLPSVASVAEPAKPVSVVLKERKEKQQLYKLKLEDEKRAKSTEEFIADNDEIDSIDDLRQIHISKETKFRIRSKAFLLTYTSHISKDDLTTFIKSKKKLIKQLKISHEDPTEKFDFKHTNLVVCFDQIIDSTSEKYFDFEDNKPYMIRTLSLTSGANQLTKAIRYLGKFDPLNTELREYGKSFVSQVLSYNSDFEALQAMCHGPNDAQGIKAIRAMKEVDKGQAEIIELGGDRFSAYPYQQLMIHLRMGTEHEDNPKYDAGQNEIIRKILDRDANRTHHGRQRAIWCMINMVGEVGKSMIASDFVAENLAHLVVDSGGGAHNVAENLSQAIDAGWDQKCVIFDFSRGVGSAEKDGIYQTLECVKNGKLNKSKYNSRTIIMKGRPMLFTLQNFKIKVLDKLGNPTMSLDRWNPIAIDGKGNIDIENTNYMEEQLEKEKMIYARKAKCKSSYVLVKRDKKGKIMRDPEEQEQDEVEMMDPTEASKFFGNGINTLISNKHINI